MGPWCRFMPDGCPGDGIGPNKLQRYFASLLPWDNFQRPLIFMESPLWGGSATLQDSQMFTESLKYCVFQIVFVTAIN
jgi:hypothetical protein